MKKKNLFWISLAFTLVLFASINQIDQYLQNEIAPDGIVSFELAKTLEQSTSILNSWDAEAKIYAALSLGIDYLFMVAYGSFFVLAVLLLAEKLQNGFLKKTAKIMAFVILLAALLDGIENFGLIQLLIDDPTQLMASLAFYCASIKFGLLGIGVVYLLAGLIVLGLKKRTIK